MTPNSDLDLNLTYLCGVMYEDPSVGVVAGGDHSLRYTDRAAYKDQQLVHLVHVYLIAQPAMRQR